MALAADTGKARGPGSCAPLRGLRLLHSMAGGSAIYLEHALSVLTEFCLRTTGADAEVSHHCLRTTSTGAEVSHRRRRSSFTHPIGSDSCAKSMSTSGLMPTPRILPAGSESLRVMVG